jgi:hypothetical protein
MKSNLAAFVPFLLVVRCYFDGNITGNVYGNFNNIVQLFLAGVNNWILTFLDFYFFMG